MRFIPLLSACAALLLAAAAQADPVCAPSATVATHNYPGASAIPTGNNLLLPAGKAVWADGQQVTIYGRVLDTHCAPVPNAIVELWQNSPTGRWLLAGRDDLASARPVFAGAGRTYTDNDGNFSFITAFPAPLKGAAPYVSMKVMGHGIPDLNTVLYFSGDARNGTEKAYSKLSSKMRDDTLIHMSQGEADDLIGQVTLVIATRAPYRSY